MHCLCHPSALPRFLRISTHHSPPTACSSFKFSSPSLPMHQHPSSYHFHHYPHVSDLCCLSYSMFAHYYFLPFLSTVAVILRLSLASYASAPVTALPPHVRSLSSFKFSSPSLHMHQHPSSYHLHRYPHISDHCCLSYRCSLTITSSLLYQESPILFSFYNNLSTLPRHHICAISAVLLISFPSIRVT